jgi:REP element-mobilizing transposase RayT
MMSNHVHLLVSSAVIPIVDWIRDWKRQSVLHLRASDRSSLPMAATRGRFWLKGLGYDRDIWSWQEYLEKLDYIELNPVRAQIVTRCAGYEWSSAFDREQGQRAGFPTLAPPPDWLVDLLG